MANLGKNLLNCAASSLAFALSIKLDEYSFNALSVAFFNASLF